MKNKFDIDALLSDALKSAEVPNPELIEKIKRIKEREDFVMKKSIIRHSFSYVAAVVLVLTLFCTTAFAAWYFLKPSEVADNFSDKALSAAFESETAININQSITSGDYIFTLLAIVSGEDITDNPTYSNGEIHNDRTYTVVVIEKKDGSMPNPQDIEYNEISFYISPYIKGLKPWQVNAHTMNGGYSETVVDGVMYRIIECDEVAMFADKGVYLGINTGAFYNSEAFFYDETTGTLTANPNFDGISLVFDLPLNKDFADPEKAEKYLGELLGEADN